MANLDVGEMGVWQDLKRGWPWGSQTLRGFPTPKVARGLQGRRPEGPCGQEHGCWGLFSAWAKVRPPDRLHNSEGRERGKEGEGCICFPWLCNKPPHPLFSP